MMPIIHIGIECRSRLGLIKRQTGFLKTTAQIHALDNAVKKLTTTYQLAAQCSEMAGRIQPLALIDKCIGSRIWIILKVKAVNLVHDSFS